MQTRAATNNYFANQLTGLYFYQIKKKFYEATFASETMINVLTYQSLPVKVTEESSDIHVSHDTAPSPSSLLRSAGTHILLCFVYTQ